MPAIILTLFPTIALIAGGYWMRQQAWLGQEFWSGAEKLNYYVLFPALLFLSLSGAQVAWLQLSQVVWSMLLVLALALAVLLGLTIWRGWAPAQFGVYVQSTVRFNTYIGVTTVAALTHGAGASILALILAIAIPVVNVVSVLSLLPKEKMNVLAMSKSLLKNPLIAACIIGIGFNLAHVSLWVGVVQWLQLLSNSSLTLGLLCVGAALQFRHIRQSWAVVLLNSAVKLLLMPLLALAVCVLFDLEPLSTQVLLLFFALPTASAAYVLTKVLDGDAPLMASIISLQTLLSVLSLPLWMYLTA